MPPTLETAPSLFDPGEEGVQWGCVDHPVPSYAGALHDPDRHRHVVELGGPVGVAVGRETHPGPGRLGSEVGGQVHAVPVAVDLQGGARLGGGLEDRPQIDVETRPYPDPPARGVGEHVDGWVARRR